jgi:hypothetical protein
MSNPALKAARRAWDSRKLVVNRPAHYMEAAAREALKPVRELHKPFWENCINACCCSGEQCKHRSRLCAGCDEYWPCATAKLVYAADDLT